MADAAATMAQLLDGMSKESLLALAQQIAQMAGAQPPLPQQPAAAIATPQPVVAPVQTQMQPAAQPVTEAVTRAQLCDSVAAECIAGWLAKGGLPPIADAVAEMMVCIKMAIESRNTGLTQGEARMKVPVQIPEIAVARYIVATGNVAMLRLDAESKTCKLGVRKDRSSIWQILLTPLKERNGLRSQIRRANPEANKAYLENVIMAIEDMATVREITHDGCSIPCANGVVDVRTRQLIPYEDCCDKYTFIYRLRVNYNENATNVVIHNDEDDTDWDVESWMEEIADSHNVAELLWEIIGATLRPYERWNKCVFFYGETGKNGKGTLMQMIRAMYDGDVASLPVSKFEDRFAVQNLAKVALIMTDENEDDLKIEKCRRFKACVTGDVIDSDVKFGEPITIHWQGFMVQCINQLFTCSSKTGAFEHRLLFVPFTKCFTGKERKYIKKDYIVRREVQEYILRRIVAMGPYNELSEPYESQLVKEDYIENNNLVYAFMGEIAEDLIWDLVPYDFLFDLYNSWRQRNGYSFGSMKKTTVTKQINSWAKKSKDWVCFADSPYIRRGNMMDRPEPLISEYNVEEWKNKDYRGGDMARVCSVNPIKSRYRGIIRRSRFENEPVHFQGMQEAS